MSRAEDVARLESERLRPSPPELGVPDLLDELIGVLHSLFKPRPVPLPAYTGTRIYTCPECDGDVRQDGPEDYYCPACRHTFYFTQVGVYEDRDRDD